MPKESHQNQIKKSARFAVSTLNKLANTFRLFNPEGSQRHSEKVPKSQSWRGGEEPNENEQTRALDNGDSSISPMNKKQNRFHFLNAESNGTNATVVLSARQTDFMVTHPNNLGEALGTISQKEENEGGTGSNQTQGQGPDACVVCCEVDGSCVYLPCGHGGICWECAKSIWKSSGLCHFCKQVEFQ